jgi:hypothetical protein
MLTTSASASRAADGLLIPAVLGTTGTILAKTQNINYASGSGNGNFVATNSGNSVPLEEGGSTAQAATYNGSRTLQNTFGGSYATGVHTSASAGSPSGTSIDVDGGTATTDGNAWAGASIAELDVFGNAGSAAGTYGNLLQIAAWTVAANASQLAALT